MYKCIYMKFKIFLSFISFKLIFSQFLDKMLADLTGGDFSVFEIYNDVISKSGNDLINFFFSKSYLHSHKREHKLIKIDTYNDEIIAELTLDKTIVYYNELENGITVYISENDQYHHTISFKKGEEFFFETNFTLPSIFSNFYISHKDNLFIIFYGGHERIYTNNEEYLYPKILTFKYPYTSLEKEITVNFKSSKERGIISLKDAYILYYDHDEKNSNITTIFVIFDSNFNFIKTKNISFPDNELIISKRISEFSETEFFNEFIFCLMYNNFNNNKSICKIIKYENSDLNFGEDFILFQNLTHGTEFWLDKIYIYLFKENNINKILFICYNSLKTIAEVVDSINQAVCYKSYLFSLATYEEGKLIFDKNIYQYNYTIKENLKINEYSKIISNQKGIGIFYVYKYIGIYYLNSICYSRRIFLKPNKLLEFPSNEIFFKGVDYFSFYFIKIDEHLEIFKDNTKIKENEIFTSLEKITYFFNVESPENNLNNLFYLKVGMSPKKIVCDIEIEILVDFIDISNNLHKCVLNESFNAIHNITNNNFNTSIKLNEKTKYVEIYYKIELATPKGNELRIYYNDIPIDCTEKYYRNVTCKIPKNILKLYDKCEFYSKLSCKNKVYLGWIIITDEYIIQAYDLNPKTLPFEKISKIYDASQPITEFSSNMINYYYWFSCFAYCDDDFIARNKCCSNILKEWELVYHKQYNYSFSNDIYYYSFVIFKNDKFKKIIVAFPGTENKIQLFSEFWRSNLKTIKENGNFKIEGFFYDNFELIREDLINKLLLLSGTKNEEYQIIYTGHSLGGALATVSSFYCVLKEFFVSKPILITFGQPRVGDEKFAKYVTSHIKQIYRIARLKDIVTLIPFNEDGYEDFEKYIKKRDWVLAPFKTLKDLEKITLNFFNKYSHYSHIGGLYMIKDSKPDKKYENKIYHCADFFNNNTSHSICYNNLFSKAFYNLDITLENHNYLILEKDNISTGCQNKELTWFPKKIGKKKKEKKNSKNTNRLLYYRRLLNIQDISYLKANEEFHFENNNISQILLQYKIKEDVNFNENILILKIDGKNSMFFGEICYSFNLNSIINEDYDNDDKIICYRIYTNKAITINIDIAKKSNENILYFYLKGKISGYIELLDFSQKKILNSNSSYYLPQIDDINSDKNIIFSIEEIKENINLNIMLINNDCSVFEIYENNHKIECNNELPNIIILKKNNKYEFIYYPYGKNELIINFINQNSNEFLNKTFFTLDSQKFYINYNINDNKNEKDNFSLYFEIKGKIELNAYFSNEIEFNNNLDTYNINTEKNFLNIKNELNTKYININLNVYYTYSYDFIITEIDEIIEVIELNVKYNISKGKNILFDFSSEKSNFVKFNSYILFILYNPNNIIKLRTSNDNIITNNNYLLEILSNVENIFISGNEEDIFEIRLIPETIGKNIDFNLPIINSNIFEQNKEWIIEYIYPMDSDILFYKSINDKNDDMEIYQLNPSSKFNLELLINKKFDDYKNIFSNKTRELKPYNSYIFLKKCKNRCIYAKYVNQIYEFEHSLEQSKIIYLFNDFEYYINYNKSITKLKIKKLNNFNTIIDFYCQNKLIHIQNIEQIINSENCKGEFSIKGNNSLIYIFIPVSLDDDIGIFNNTKSIVLNNIQEFIFIPNEKRLNSINLSFSNKNYLSNKQPISFLYFINHNTIPYSRIISRHYIQFEEKIAISLPNYKQNYINNEEYFIYFIFDEKVLNLQIKVNYENIISLEESDDSIFISSGISILKLEKLQNYYINIIVDGNNKLTTDIKYSILRNGIINEKEKDIVLDSDNIYFSRSSNEKDIKIRFENKKDILFILSSEPFYDFSMINQDKNILVNQFENILNITFNTTEYESNIEYNIAIIEKNSTLNLKKLSHYLYHYFTFNNNSLINLLYSSSGIEPVSIELDVDEYFNDNKSCIILVLGKQKIEESYNHIYYNPIEFNVSKNKIEIEKEKENNNSKSNSGKIVGIIIGIIILIGIAIAIIYFYRKKKSNFHSLPNLNKNI